MPTMGQAAPVAPASLTVQGFAQLLAAYKKAIFQNGNNPNTTVTLFIGISGSASLEMPVSH